MDRIDETHGNRIKALLVGHSYVRRLVERMEREGRSDSNLGFDASKVKVFWSTYGGATV
jgi:hypothetical protein